MSRQTAKESEIDRLLREFEDCSIARSDWNHRAHMIMALVYVLRHGAPEGARRIREGILRYNAKQRIYQTPTDGYHETLTQFYIAVVQDFVRKCDATRPVHELATELYADYGDRELPFQYYSRDLLNSWRARTEWVQPDLRPLD